MFKNANLIHGGGKEPTFELLASQLYDEIQNPDNIIFFEKIRLYLVPTKKIQQT